MYIAGLTSCRRCCVAHGSSFLHLSEYLVLAARGVTSLPFDHDLKFVVQGSQLVPDGDESLAKKLLTATRNLWISISSYDPSKPTVTCGGSSLFVQRMTKNGTEK